MAAMSSAVRWMLVFCLSACTGGQSAKDTGGLDESLISDATGIFGIVVVPSEVIVPLGSEVRLQAIALDGDRQSSDVTDAVEWASGSPSIAQVSNSLAKEGTLTGEEPGVTTVHAEFDGILSSPAWVTVTNAELSELVVSPTSILVSPGDTVQLNAEATFADGQSSDASSQVRWITADGAVATLNTTGLLEAVSNGETSIHAEWNGISSDPVSVTVSDTAGLGPVDLVFHGLFGQINDGTLEIFVDIQNTGDGVAENFWVDLFVDPIIEPSFGDLASTFYMVDYLGPGEYTTVTFTADTPQSYHTFAVLLDSMEEVAEESEDNNLAFGDTSGESSVELDSDDSPSSLPNLEFEFVGGFSSETSTTFWIDVINSGSSTSEDFYIDVFVDAKFDRPPDSEDEGTNYEYQSGLEPGELVMMSIEVPVSCDSCGNWVMIDGMNFVEESNEDDNLAWFEMGGDWYVVASAR